MRSSFNLPSATYNLILTKEELNSLLEKGYVGCVVKRVPCITQRQVWNGDDKKFEAIARKETENNLRFYVDGELADCGDKEWGVQFLNIVVEEGEEDG